MKKCLFLVVWLTLALGLDAHGARRLTNVVFILADDLGYGDLGCYGAPDIQTPNIDRLAREGVRFTDFYANGCVCTPTRCAFMTGRYQQRIGGLETAIPAGGRQLGLPSTEKTLAQMLGERGYRTALCGKWHLGYTRDKMPDTHGFDHFFGLLSGNHNYFTHRENNGEADLYVDGEAIERKGYSTHLITSDALGFLRQNRANPFFLYLAYNAPHWPYQGPDDENVELTKQTWARGTRETYVRMVEEMDKGVGEVLAAIDALGLRESTLVVFTSDNGGDKNSRNAPLSNNKGTLWEGGIRVPCIARFPGTIPAGTETHQPGITMDWTATIAKLAGAKAPKGRAFEGIDLLPQISKPVRVKPRTFFWRRVNFSFEQLHVAARDGNWKYIQDLKTGEEYLYDLGNDVGETRNIASGNPKVVAQLKKKVKAWQDDVDPPLYPAEPSIRKP